MTNHPEHEKLHKAKAELHLDAIGDFLVWLEQDGRVIAKFDDETSGYWPDRETAEKRLARYAGIDRDKLEDEKRAMLDEFRAAQKAAR